MYASKRSKYAALIKSETSFVLRDVMEKSITDHLHIFHNSTNDETITFSDCLASSHVCLKCVLFEVFSVTKKVLNIYFNV